MQKPKMLPKKFAKFLTIVLIFLLGKICAEDTAKTSPATTKRPEATICSICKCTEERKESEFHDVDCRNYHLINRIPNAKDLPPKTRYLYLAKNNITELKKFEAMDDLTHLDLSINTMEKIDNFAFEPLKQLVFLDLSFNSLKEIPSTLFEGLGELQYLNLSSNKIESLPADLFKSNTFLNNLNLANNPISFINPDTFSYLNELHVLSLASNRIFSLQDGFFKHTTKLQSLDLSFNLFPDVPNKALRLLKNLQELDLSGNPIQNLNENSFLQLNSLIELNLNKMPSLKRIEKKTFSTQRNMRFLNITDNPHLSTINEHAFLGMFDSKTIVIQEVRLRRNSLNRLSDKLLPFCNLTLVDLRANPWHCDCHLHWMQHCPGPKEYQIEILCSQPVSLAGMEVVVVPKEQFTCHNARHTHYLFLASMFFMTGLFLSVFMLIFRNQITKYYGSHKRREGSIYYVRAQSDADVGGP